MGVEIDGKWYTWTSPICERCWALQHGGPTGPWEHPVRVTEQDVEQCVFCGFPTWAGIFVRANPRDVPYPRVDPD